MTAADILRERALYTTPNGQVFVHADVVRAVADLMEACILKDVCLICDRRMEDAKYPWGGRHADTCPLAALERLITEKRDGV